MLPSVNNRIRDLPSFDLFDSFFNDWHYKPTVKRNSYFTMPINVEEREEEYLITAELPGINREDIDITLEKNKLNLKINGSEQKEEKTTKYLYKERKSYSGNRTISLPTNITEDKINANLSEGILNITVQKVPEEQIKKITIN